MCCCDVDDDHNLMGHPDILRASANVERIEPSGVPDCPRVSFENLESVDVTGSQLLNSQTIHTRTAIL